MSNFIRVLFGPAQPYQKPRSPRIYTWVNSPTRETDEPFSIYEGLAEKK